MKYSYNWLKKLTKTKKSVEELAQMVTLKGFELENIEDLEERFNGFVVGEILEIKKHPNADKLQLVKVDTGWEKLDIVCGATNIKIGDKVPVATLGAVMPWKKIKIEKTQIRGVESNGMLCAEDELGLGKDHSGIMNLNSELKPGTSLTEALELDDKILEFNILPNRAHDCLSYNGMANEISAMEGNKLKCKSSKLKTTSQSSKLLKVEIKDKKLCPRYMGAVLTNVEIKPAPRWMQNRLIASGMEPINNVVDITNYVMLEIGNPLHAFDYKKLKTQNSKLKNTTQNSKVANIIIRKAEESEKLELLDGTFLKLNKNDLVIANEEKALALAGIKGGKYSGINSDTNTIVLESANFNPYSVRKTRQRHNLLTEAQARFEKGISPVLTEKALTRAIELFEKYAGARLEEIADENYHKKEELTVEFNLTGIEKLLGEKVNKEEAIEILEKLGFKSAGENKEKITLKVPYWRLDIEGSEDLAEEVGRIFGYEKIKEQAILAEVEAPEENKQRKFEWKLKKIMAGLGLDEAVNYSFYNGKEIEKFGVSGEHFQLENPLAEEQSSMRRTLLPHLTANIGLNQKYFKEFAIFELGKAYFVGKNNNSDEKLKLAAGVFNAENKDEIFYDIKGRLESLINALGLDDSALKFLVSDNIKYFHPKKSVKVFLAGKELGIIGELSGEICQGWDIEGKAGVFEIDFNLLFKSYVNVLAKAEYYPISKFPRVLRDISMFIDCKTEAKIIEDIIKKTGGKLLLEVNLFDVYWDKKQSEKSLAFHLEFGSDKKTLESETVDKLMEEIIKKLEARKARVRKQ